MSNLIEAAKALIVADNRDALPALQEANFAVRHEHNERKNAETTGQRMYAVDLERLLMKLTGAGSEDCRRAVAVALGRDWMAVSCNAICEFSRSLNAQRRSA